MLVGPLGSRQAGTLPAKWSWGIIGLVLCRLIKMCCERKNLEAPAEEERRMDLCIFLKLMFTLPVPSN